MYVYMLICIYIFNSYETRCIRLAFNAKTNNYVQKFQTSMFNRKYPKSFLRKLHQFIIAGQQRACNSG